MVKVGLSAGTCKGPCKQVPRRELAIAMLHRRSHAHLGVGALGEDMRWHQRQARGTLRGCGARGKPLAQGAPGRARASHAAASDARRTRPTQRQWPRQQRRGARAPWRWRGPSVARAGAAGSPGRHRPRGGAPPSLDTQRELPQRSSLSRNLGNRIGVSPARAYGQGAQSGRGTS